MKTALLGGSFDPVHYGHISVLEAAAKELAPDRLIIMPAHISPFKTEKWASDRDRLAMAELAAELIPLAEVSSWETDRESVSYTWDTLSALSEGQDKAEIYFLTGSDSFITLDTWYRGKELLRTFSFGICRRPGCDENVLRSKINEFVKLYGARITVLNGKPVYVSSTEIRERVSAGLSVRGLVPAKVEDYIYEHGLYKKIS